MQQGAGQPGGILQTSAKRKKIKELFGCSRPSISTGAARELTRSLPLPKKIPPPSPPAGISPPRSAPCRRWVIGGRRLCSGCCRATSAPRARPTQGSAQGGFGEPGVAAGPSRMGVLHRVGCVTQGMNSVSPVSNRGDTREPSGRHHSASFLFMLQPRAPFSAPAARSQRRRLLFSPRVSPAAFAGGSERSLPSHPVSQNSIFFFSAAAPAAALCFHSYCSKTSQEQHKNLGSAGTAAKAAS